MRRIKFKDPDREKEELARELIALDKELEANYNTLNQYKDDKYNLDLKIANKGGRTNAPLETLNDLDEVIKQIQQLEDRQTAILARIQEIDNELAAIEAASAAPVSASKVASPISKVPGVPSAPRVLRPVPRSEPSPRRASSQKWLMLALLGLVIAIVDILIIWPRIQSEKSAYVLVDDSYHHLGDNVYNEDYIKMIGGDLIKHLDPEGIVYSTHFDIADLRREAGVSFDVKVARAAIELTVNHIKPREDAPVFVFLNKDFQGFINDKVQREQFKRTPVSIELKPDDILEHNNDLSISVGRDNNQGDYEDMEFNDLRLRVYFDQREPNLIYSILIAVGEFLILGICWFRM